MRTPTSTAKPLYHRIASGVDNLPRQLFPFDVIAPQSNLDKTSNRPYRAIFSIYTIHRLPIDPTPLRRTVIPDPKAAMKDQFLIFERDTVAYHCGLIHEGIRRYFKDEEHDVTFLPLGLSDLDSIDLLHPDARLAILCWLDLESSVESIRELGYPYINLREAEEMSNIGLHIAFQGEGRLAAEYFIDEMGLESLAYVGIAHHRSHRRRFEEFERAAKERHLDVERHLLPSKRGSSGNSGMFSFDRIRTAERHEELTALLRDSPKPFGIFCANDRIALSLYYRAQELGIDVPEEVSILGVGSLHRADEGGVQAISVVQMDHFKHGFHAARMMERYLSGKPIENKVILSPDGIVHRGTTCRRLVKDPLVRKTFGLIEEDRSVTVNELSRRLSVSRRTLENRFLAAANMTVAKAIEWERFHRAKQLLKSSRFSHGAIASLAGYRNHKQMIRSFDRFVQMSPRQFARAYLAPKESS